MVGVPELATRFADPLLSAAVVVLLVSTELANTLRHGIFLSAPLSRPLSFTRNRIVQWSVVRAHTRSRGGGPKSFLCVCRIPFFPLDCRHSQHGKTCEAPKKRVECGSILRCRQVGKLGFGRFLTFTLTIKELYITIYGRPGLFRLRCRATKGGCGTRK